MNCCACRADHCDHEGGHEYCLKHLSHALPKHADYKLPSVQTSPLVADQAAWTIKPYAHPTRITFQGNDHVQKLEIDIDKGTIELEGNWDAAAVLFIERCKAILGVSK